MRESQPYNDQLRMLVGENVFAEPFLWFTSVLLGILTCKIVYNVMQALSPVYSKSYRKLSKLQKIEWDNRGFSTFHAILVSVIGAKLLCFSDFFSDDAPFGPVIFRSTIFSQSMAGVSIGYFLSDLGMIVWFYPALGGAEYVLHHLLSAASLALSLYSGHAQIYIYIVLFSEITTPFVNLRWYLSVSGLKNSKLYIINGVLLFFGWLMARVLLFVYLFFHIYLHYDQVREIFPLGFYALIIVSPSLTVMNLYWLYKIVRGMIRMLSKRA
eukprot:c22392_g1_i2 orf=349-1155(-)